MIGTQIQWADDTCNPAPGCDGCPLWPSTADIRNALIRFLAAQDPERSLEQVQSIVHGRISDLTATAVYKGRKEIVATLLADLGVGQGAMDSGVEVVEALFRCYAGNLTMRYGGHSKGYPVMFEKVTLFPDRMAKAAAARDLTGAIRSDKPWLNHLPRTIFVSDMGDMLSKEVTFDYLHQEVIDVVSSLNGKRHTWLWLTKRPGRMVKFWKWLRSNGIEWPANLVPMTSVISQSMAHSAEILAQIEAPFHGLSVEPLWEPVQVPLAGIDWVIVGGESGKYAKPFDIAWARDIQRQCRNRGVAFFLKQLGQKPVENGQTLKRNDPHGGDWSGWPQDLRVREFPAGFYRNAKVSAMQAEAVAG